MSEGLMNVTPDKRDDKGSKGAALIKGGLKWAP